MADTLVNFLHDNLPVQAMQFTCQINKTPLKEPCMACHLLNPGVQDTMYVLFHRKRA